MAERVAGALVAGLAATTLAAYGLALVGAGILPGLAAAIGGLTGLLVAHRAIDAGNGPPLWAWGLVAGGVGAALAAAVSPAWLPPAGGSDLVHHLMLVDVLDRTRHLVDAAASEAALGEMARYTPGSHLLIVVVGALAGLDPWRMVLPLVALTVALKAGFVFLIANRAVPSGPYRLPLALSAAPLVAWAPRAYSVDSFLQAGFIAQVVAELFAVAAWWALARWADRPATGAMALVGLLAAAVFIAWPTWVGPLMLATLLVVALTPRLPAPARLRTLLLAGAPVALVAAPHLWRHAASLSMAGAAGFVPPLAPGASGWGLVGLALAGAVLAGRGRVPARVTLLLVVALLAQGVGLYVLARLRGSAVAYMAVKMVYFAIYPMGVLASVSLAEAIERLPARPRPAVARGLPLAAVAVAAFVLTRQPLPPPIVSPDLHAAGRWAREHLHPACVGYLVDNAEVAYWLHLAVMRQPRASPRTADIDGYTPNREIGRWIAGTPQPYAIARLSLLPSEVLAETEIVHRVGDAVVIAHPGRRCADDAGPDRPQMRR